jgi:hypothetical protein
VRLAFVQELTLKTALLAVSSSTGSPIQSAQKVLGEWLDSNSQLADETYGAAFQDPSLTALYADEVLAIVTDMKKMLAKIAASIGDT